jgi:hypothetical protein
LRQVGSGRRFRLGEEEHPQMAEAV